jgi:hypothetical protein
MYGRDTFTGLLNNMRTRLLFLGSLGDEEAQYFSQMMGHHTSDTFSWSSSDGGSRVAVSERALPMVAAEEMTWKWPPHSVAIRTGGTPPFVAQCPPAIALPRFRSKLVDNAPPEAMVPRPDGSVDIKPPAMPDLLAHYSKKTALALFRAAFGGSRRAGGVVANGNGTKGAQKSAVAATITPPATSPATPPAASPPMANSAPGDTGGIPRLIIQVPRTTPGGTSQTAPPPAPPVEEGPKSAAQDSPEAAAQSAPPAQAESAAPAQAAASSVPLVALGAEELATRIAHGLLDLYNKEPSLLAAVKVLLTRDRKIAAINIPRQVLERLFGPELGVALRKWVQDLDWMKPMVAERFRADRPLCDAMPESLQQALIRRFVYGRRGSAEVAPIATASAPSAEAARKFVELCVWVAAHTHRIGGHPSFKGPDADGLWEEGKSVSVLPHVIHKVIGGVQDTNWPLWKEWAKAGWIEVEPGRLTKVVRWLNGELRRVVWIAWEAYERASSGQTPPALSGAKTNN